MSDPTRWPPGASIVWRSLPGGMVGTVLAVFMLEDAHDAVVVFQPAGAPRKRRTGRRGGPQGRNLLPGGWDGSYEDSPFPGPSMVRLHPTGASFSVIRRWDSEIGRCRGWYVNLEQPWVRTPLGFDSHDDVLDIRVADDLSSWAWKDEDELAWSVEAGKLSRAYADAVRSAGEDAIAKISSGAWPFADDAWARFVPPLELGLPSIPDGWERAR